MRFAFPGLLAVSLTGCISIDFGPSQRYQEDFRYTYDLQPGGRINLENINGAVEITGWDQQKVEIEGVKSAPSREALSELRIDIHNSPAFLEIRTVRPSGFRGGGARYVLRVPRSAVLDRVSSSNGRLSVSDMDGGGYFKTSNGSIRASHLRGSVDAETSNGSIDLESVTGGVKMRTSNGRIRADGIDGEFDARTSNSSITIEMVHAPKDDIRAETSNGSITVKIPGDSAVRLAADTSNGSIRTDFGENETSRNVHIDKSINGGGPLIHLTTRNGSISLLRN